MTEAVDLVALQRTLRPYVSRRVAASDVDDVLQDAILRVHRSAGRVHDPSRLSGWVMKVAHSAVAEHWAQRQRHPLADGGLVPEASEDAWEAVEDREDARMRAALAAWIWAQIEDLPPAYRDALRWDLEGVPQQEAARRAGLSWSGMKSRVQRARRMLHDRVEACCAVALDRRARVMACVPRPSGLGCGAACGVGD